MQIATKAQLRDCLSESVYVSIHTYGILLLPNKYFYWFHYFLSLWEFFSAKLKSQGLVTDDWPSG